MESEAKERIQAWHPFGSFVPPKAKYLLLGSFTGKIEDRSYDWFYTNKRNQFWRILRAVYDEPLESRISKEDLFTRLNLAITDIIYLPSPSPRYAKFSLSEKTERYTHPLPALQ